MAAMATVLKFYFEILLLNQNAKLTQNSDLKSKMPALAAILKMYFELSLQDGKAIETW